ncbi:lipoprotein insertase outer membrane protein LolB [Hydrogenophaga sp.]|uniref:lipoprotein insertase outer membrane protein LolB n=1 Tax=Hydrogenophaga sp. TaxID=1904254 RepID=UPI003D0DD846
MNPPAWRGLRSMGCVLVTALLLAACATRHPMEPGGEAVWSGRLSLQVDSTPPQSFSSTFDLRGAPSAGELQLSSPLGNTLATVVWTPGSAELRQGSQITRRGSLDELTTELSGTAVPVAALFGWLRGEQGDVPGWQADLSRQPQGRITARRSSPLPTAELRVIFQP